MVTDVDRLRIIYELDDLPAAKAFRRLREEAERTNAAIKGGATGAEQQVVDSAKRGADEAVKAERAKADAAEAAARKQADAARVAAREQIEAARASAAALKAAEKEKAEAAKKAAAEAKAAATALAAAEKQASAEAKEAAKRAAAETAEASRRATAQAKAAAAERAAADKAAAEASKKAAKDKAAAEMAATEAADKAVSAGIYRQRMIGMQLSQVGQQAAATGNLMQAMAIQLPDLALLAGGAGMAMAGAGAALAISLAPALLDAIGKSKSLAERMKALEASTDDMVAAADAAATPISELREKFGDLADEIARENSAAAQMTALRARYDLIGTAKGVSKKYGVGDLATAAPIYDGATGAYREMTRDETVKAYLEQLQYELGAGAEQADKLRIAIDAIGESTGPEQIVIQVEAIMKVLNSFYDTATEEQRKAINSMADQINAIGRTAQSQIAAERSDWARLLSSYDANGKKLANLAADRENLENRLAEITDKNSKKIISGKEAEASAINKMLQALDAEVSQVQISIAKLDGSFDAFVERMKARAGEIGGSVRDLRRGGTLKDGLIDAAFVGVGAFYAGPRWWPVAVMLTVACGALIKEARNGPL